MKSLISWKTLFAMMIALTIFLVSAVLYSIKSDRNKLQTIINKLVGSIETADVNNQNMKLSIDSLTNRVTYLTSKIVNLETRKDSLRRGLPRPSSKVQMVENSASISIGSKSLSTNVNLNIDQDKPVFVVKDQTGKVIDLQKGITGSVSTLTVSAGAGFKIKSMEIELGRGTERLVSMSLQKETVDISILLAQARPGDRIIIIIRKVVKIAGDKLVPVHDGFLIIPLN